MNKETRQFIFCMVFFLISVSSACLFLVVKSDDFMSVKIVDWVLFIVSLLGTFIFGFGLHDATFGEQDKD